MRTSHVAVIILNPGTGRLDAAVWKRKIWTLVFGCDTFGRRSFRRDTFGRILNNGLWFFGFGLERYGLFFATPGPPA